MKNNIIVRCVAMFCACFLLLLAADCFIPGDERDIYEGVVRLHILANSNDSSDQSVKIMVRDAILESCGDLFIPEDDSVSAREKMTAASERMEKIADTVLRENGFDYTARAVFGKEDYPTREYGDVTLPAGEYYSLRLLLGSGEGENWWCILFPPLCTKASGSRLTQAGIDENTGKVFTEKRYVFRFRFLEWFR